ncbi:Txe/YoeB family addiction module toxin [Lentilactobacillus sunkii]|uniref:Endoribonuclease YoeB n=1 Tax=Lentilactobacillus sunkii DSM 19904 TaxID=1423808 RepID=A0A0R1L0W0_9LACO|nr:Txe/YoeB family addiction module toxin [Lentilactobacillus sunkii]KRK87331.1 RelE family toxin-antitoxin system [Lentilactobacillus sunkii DSM 19904]
MSKWQLKIKSTAKGDLRKVLKSPLRQSFENIKATLEADPFSPMQSFEKLTPPAAGFYSRRITGQHRVVYTVDKENKLVTIYSCWAHYESGSLDMSGKSGSRKN